MSQNNSPLIPREPLPPAASLTPPPPPYYSIAPGAKTDSSQALLQSVPRLSCSRSPSPGSAARLCPGQSPVPPPRRPRVAPPGSGPRGGRAQWAQAGAPCRCSGAPGLFLHPGDASTGTAVGGGRLSVALKPGAAPHPGRGGAPEGGSWSRGLLLKAEVLVRKTRGTVSRGDAPGGAVCDIQGVTVARWARNPEARPCGRLLSARRTLSPGPRGSPEKGGPRWRRQPGLPSPAARRRGRSSGTRRPPAGCALGPPGSGAGAAARPPPSPGSRLGRPARGRGRGRSARAGSPPPPLPGPREIQSPRLGRLPRPLPLGARLGLRSRRGPSAGGSAVPGPSLPAYPPARLPARRSSSSSAPGRAAGTM
ncbi:basic proline-rich protein-like [Ochotona princeps]|uniref:basic proline-rich protein-like n=1 Tax=Ochotona princeps TaxID=9978 RepID=UPI0027144D18|nr:basic proline-rich protein-like [Ochotona princeps]